jgi:DNA polymerase I-like protein with 3'-5' exonuclease and polymerase domains
VAFDLETKDDRLRADMGSGWPFGAGHICGVSVAYRDGGGIRARYFPLRHPDSDNFDSTQVYQWLRDLIASRVRIVTQNGLYDWGWLRTEAGIKMPSGAQLEEIGALATLVDENRLRYSLDDLCKWRGIPGKDDAGLKEGAAALNLPKRAKPTAHIWQMPARFVGHYAEQDAIATLALFGNLDPVLDQEKTREAYRLEVDLLPMVLEMRRRGIRVDVDAAERARDHLLQQRDATLTELSEKLGANVGMAEIRRNKWLSETFDRHGIKYPRTAKGNPSFTAGLAGWMNKHQHWLPQLVAQAGAYNKAAVDFLQHHILDHVVNGRIHAEIHPHRSDDGGTRSLRFSYSDPPLQQMAARDEEIAPLIRGCFLPEEGEVWAKPDVSQQEFRLIVHYAAALKLKGAQEAVDRYRDDPDTDFHQYVADIAGILRKLAKHANFAKVFGAGVRRFAAMIGKPEHEAQTIYDRYDKELPFVRQLTEHCERQAKRFGYIELYDGARRHWNSWVAWADWTKGAGPCGHEEAERRIADPAHPWFRRGPLHRADTRKAMNALIQGSAARHTKLWMRAVWREGIVPLLQMHDCLDLSVSSPEQAERVAQLACEVVSLLVPIRVDLKYGRNWGDAKHTWAELHEHMPVAAPSIIPEPQRTTGRVAMSLSGITQAELDEINAGLIREGIEPLTFGIASAPPEPVTQEIPKITVSIVETPVTVADAVSTEAPPWEGPAIAAAPPQSPRGNGRASYDFPGQGKILCPFHDDHNPSLHIYPDVSDPHFFCFACKRGGHLNELNELGIDWQTALRSPTGIASGAPTDEDNARNLERAHELWDKAKPIAGTLAERYLAETRGIDISALPTGIDEVLRFHPRCPFGDKHHPCLIALFRDLETGERAGIHRIALTADPQKIDRRMFGRWLRPRAIKLWPADDKLYAGEGIETVLAAATRLQMRPAWALASTSYLANLPVVSGIAELNILVDRDVHGETAAAACHQTWKNAGRRVRRLRTKDTGLNDFNDLILAKLRLRGVS